MLVLENVTIMTRNLFNFGLFRFATNWWQEEELLSQGINFALVCLGSLLNAGVRKCNYYDFF